MADEKHIVKKWSFNLDLDANRDIENTRVEVLQMLHIEMREELSLLMDGLCDGDEIIRIDRLELNLGTIEYANLKSELKQGLYNGLYKAIDEARNEQYATKSGSSSSVSGLAKAASDKFTDQIKGIPAGIKHTNDQRLNTLIYYLENGVLPWWNAFEYKVDLVTFIQSDIASVNSELSHKKSAFYQATLQAYLYNKQHGRKRFIALVKNEVIINLLGIWYPKEIHNFTAVKKWLTTLFKNLSFSWSISLESKLINLFFDLVITNDKGQISAASVSIIIQKFTTVFFLSNTSQLQNKALWLNKLKELKTHKAEMQQLIAIEKNSLVWINKLILKLDEPITNQIRKEKTTLIKQLNKTEIKEEPTEKQILQSIEFNFAGIVILWPMFTTLFKNCELIKENDFISVEAQFKALQLLNFMACGEEDLDEFQMPLNKLICGIPIQAVAEFETTLSIQDKEEVNDLLKHVIENWPVLKNTSPNGLRSAFLNRKGELDEQGEIWNLKVTESAVDILLRKLPWGYHMIKLPWMPKLIQIEW